MSQLSKLTQPLGGMNLSVLPTEGFRGSGYLLPFIEGWKLTRRAFAKPSSLPSSFKPSVSWNQTRCSQTLLIEHESHFRAACQSLRSRVEWACCCPLWPVGEKTTHWNCSSNKPSGTRGCFLASGLRGGWMSPLSLDPTEWEDDATFKNLLGQPATRALCFMWSVFMYVLNSSPQLLPWAFQWDLETVWNGARGLAYWFQEFAGEVCLPLGPFGNLLSVTLCWNVPHSVQNCNIIYITL